MGYQSGINQLLGMAAIAVKINKKVDTTTSKVPETKAPSLNTQQAQNKAMQNFKTKGDTKVKQRMTFNRFYQGLKDTPPELNGDKNLFSKLGPEAQKQVAKQLYQKSKESKK